MCFNRQMFSLNPLTAFKGSNKVAMQGINLGNDIAKKTTNLAIDQTRRDTTKYTPSPLGNGG